MITFNFAGKLARIVSKLLCQCGHSYSACLLVVNIKQTSIEISSLSLVFAAPTSSH